MYAIKSHKNAAVERKDLKLMLTKKLYKKQYTKQQIYNLFKFLDYVIALPRELTLQYSDEIHKFKEEHRMPYITSIEKLGIEKGIQQGMQQGIKQEKIEIAQYMLRKGMEITLINEITHLSLNQIKKLQINLQ